MRLAWLSDIHLDFVDRRTFDNLLDDIRAASCDGVILSGDISTAPWLGLHLTKFAEELYVPIYFVLGNHDYYESSIAAVRPAIADLCRLSRRLIWLSESPIQQLSDKTVVLGHSSWSDGRFGDYENSDVILNDHFYIRELTGVSKAERLRVMQSLADQAIAYLNLHLPGAVEAAKDIIFVTHPPPFAEACLYGGKISSIYYLPHFSCKVVGDFLKEFALSHKDKSITVICGHTHSKAEIEVLPNLKVLVAQAKYGKPRIQKLIEIE